MIIILLVLNFSLVFSCIHDQLNNNYKLLVLNDTDEINTRRLLQSQSKPTIGKYYLLYFSLRMHLDFSLFNNTSTAGKNLVNIIEIARAFWEDTIELERLNNLIFPVEEGYDRKNVLCFDLIVPERIVNSNI